MKRYVYIVMAAAAMLFAGCESEPAEVLQAEPDYATINLSSTSIVVSEEGAVKTIFAATNSNELKVLEESEWLDVSIEGNALTLYVDANDGESLREAVVDVVAGTQPDVAKARMRIVQSCQGVVNLSEEGTANCYIVPTESACYFDASVKGNGNERGDGRSRYISTYGVNIEGAAYADLAWEATYDGDKTRSTKIIAGKPIYDAEGERILLSTGECEGNALVSLHNAEGEILWSWHIWVMNDTPTTSVSVYGEDSTLEWMDRNLGALNNRIGDISNRGMLYQWGRKEPFLPSPVENVYVPRHKYDIEGNLLETEEEYYEIQEQIFAAREVVNHNNTQVGNGYAAWRFAGEVPPVALQAPGNIDYALQHPTTVLGCRVDIPIGEYVFDWYLQQDLEGVDGFLQQSCSHLWGDSRLTDDYKTIFDPCPVGYVVPPTGAFAEIPTNYACTIFGRGEWKVEDYGWRWNSAAGGNGDYFPSSGNLDVSGLIGETSEKPLYWTSESFGADYQGFGKAAMLFEAYGDIYYGIYPILDPSEAAAWYSYGAKCMAASVRCVKEQK